MSIASHRRVEDALKEIGSAGVVALVACAFALAIAAVALGIAGRFGWI